MKKNQKWILCIALLAVFILVLAIRFQMSPQEVAPEYVLSYAENQTEDYPTTLGAKYFAELVAERTNGRIKIVVSAEGALGNEADVIQQLMYGGIDFTRVSLSQLAEYAPEMNVLQMPYLYTDSNHMWRVLDGEIGASFLQDIQNYELVGLSWYDAGARNFYNTVKPISTPEDVEGMRIRVQESALMEDMVEALGATAVPISYEQVYSSLERGLCDGAENNWPSYETMDHYEVAQYFTVDEHTRVPEMQLCSIHTWEKLSEEDQAIILECAQESALYERELWVQREEKSRQKALENGVQEVVLTAAEKALFQEKMSDVYEKYCGDYMDIIEQIIEEGKK